MINRSRVFKTGNGNIVFTGTFVTREQQRARHVSMSRKKGLVEYPARPAEPVSNALLGVLCAKLAAGGAKSSLIPQPPGNLCLVCLCLPYSFPIFVSIYLPLFSLVAYLSPRACQVSISFFGPRGVSLPLVVADFLPYLSICFFAQVQINRMSCLFLSRYMPM